MTPARPRIPSYCLPQGLCRAFAAAQALLFLGRGPGREAISAGVPENRRPGSGFFYSAGRSFRPPDGSHPGRAVV